MIKVCGIEFPLTEKSIPNSSKNPRLKGHSIQTLCMFDCPSTNTVCIVRTHAFVYSHAHGRARKLQATACKQRTNAFTQHSQAYTWVDTLSIYNKGFACKTRLHRRMLSFFFLLFSSFSKFNAGGLRDLSVSRSCETNGGEHDCLFTINRNIAPSSSAST